MSKNDKQSLHMLSSATEDFYIFLVLKQPINHAHIGPLQHKKQNFETPETTVEE